MIYLVKRGDTLSGLAERFAVSEARLRSDNGIPNGQPLVVGQSLMILRPTAIFTVRSGDTLYRIAGETGISVQELLRLNPVLAEEPTLQTGQVLTVKLEGERQGELYINGYAYPHIVSSVLRRSLPFLNTLSVFSYGFRLDGTLIPPPDASLLAAAQEFDAMPVMVLTSVDENGAFNSYKAKQLFRQTELQNRVLDAIIQTMLEKGYRGLDADFEYIEAEDAEAYFSFLGNVRERLHEYGLFLHVDLAPKTYAEQPGLLYTAHNYPIIGELADSVLIMTYEWGYAYGPPMAVAPLPQVEAVLRYAVSEIPPRKIQMGIPNYGYDWILPYEQGRRATTLGNEEAVRLAAEVGAEIQFDPVAQSPFFHYTRQGESHVVWFEDARSVEAKLRLAQELDLTHIAYWNLLRPFAPNWALLSEIRGIVKQGQP